MKNILINVIFATLSVIAIVLFAFIVEFLFTHYAEITISVLAIVGLFFMCYMAISVARSE